MIYKSQSHNETEDVIVTVKASLAIGAHVENLRKF